MRDEIAGDDLDPVRGADDRFQLRPFGLEFLLALDLLALGQFLEFGVDLRPLRGLQLELGEPALVIDRHCRAVDDRALDVVDADVVAKDGARIGVGLLDRRAGEADERGVRQCVVQVPGEAVDEIVLAAMRLVGDHDDIAPLDSTGWRSPFSSGHEFLDGREHNAAGAAPQLLAQIRAAFGLLRVLPQQLADRCERGEQLVVEVVAVGDDDDGRVFHRRVQDQPPGIEGHRQAFARALRVPDDPDPLVAGLAAGAVPREIAFRPPPRLSGARLAARSVSSTATLTAWNW